MKKLKVEEENFIARKNKTTLLREIYDDTTSIQSEAYQKLQVNLDYASIDKKYKIISCVSAEQAEGKTTTLVNLANVYALKGAKVLVIDLDLRSPVIHKYFKIPNEVGITDYLTDKVPLEDIIHKDAKQNIDVITRDGKTPFPSKLLESDKLHAFIESVKDEYDYIFVDICPLLLFSDAILVSKFVEVFVLVLAMGITRKSDLKEVMKLIRTDKLNVVGAVLTRMRISRKGYACGYGYGQSHSYGPSYFSNEEAK